MRENIAKAESEANNIGGECKLFSTVTIHSFKNNRK